MTVPPTALSPPVRRLLALGLLALAAVLGDALILGPWLDARAAYRQRIEDDRAFLARLDHAAARRRDEIAAVLALRDDPRLAALFLAPGDDGVAAAALQTLVKTAADGAGTTVASAEVLPTVRRPGARVIAVAVELSAGLDRLTDLLRRLEAGRPLVRVRSLELRAADSDAGTLDVAFEAVAYAPETGR